MLLLKQLTGRRLIHTVPKLPNNSQLSTKGIPKIYSSNGFSIVWNNYQKYLCDKLTMYTSGTANESYFPFHLILRTAKNPFESHIFNTASALHNNHLFIENILPSENETGGPSTLLNSRFKESFEMEWGQELKDNIVKLIEEKIIGQGWFFIIENSDKQLNFLTVHNNGTPYYFPRNQSIDLSNAISFEEFNDLQTIKQAVKEDKVKDWNIPLVAINLWDHAYLHDYGVDKRSEYIQNVLDNLNWDVINNRLYTQMD
ncbi:hypothetical protein KAFR_0G00870 [Kazachstania africana CBS 2517]|uniref:Manganese/iron superoxide dismutase C-terminal domain-containing protein n=1 Tax=Kazachstania africana (strain ATCC 22294 / BCRC 22015 / CBS 2517 / CECT 1963 / NBRC 1671 / NRRL Y-8276) TaxID=1071382 RepID=H2AXM0_KAZAF|nr:hypothetical protein KAFR_0G00870 [Kazachstania africana CBS 2517]CCF59120.1 hypothetical protein KAFR_0G00870 [Kazachstania africana CBS 2517]